MRKELDNHDLNELVRELNLQTRADVETDVQPSLATAPEASPSHSERTEERRLADPLRRVIEPGHPLAGRLLAMIERGASDLHLVPGHPPTLRVDDQLVATSASVL